MISRTTLEQALVEAVEAKKYAVVEDCLRNGAKGTATLYGDDDNALHIAAMQNDPKMINLLLKYNVNTATENIDEEIAIESAAVKGLWDGVIAFAKARKEYGGKFGSGIALLLAARANQYQAVEALLKAGASTNCAFPDTRNTALHHAVDHKNAHMVSLLISYKANPNQQNAQHVTPVQLASKRNFLDCARAFVDPHKFLKEISGIQISLFYLFSAHSNESNPFSRIPYDVLKLILNFAFGNLCPGIYNYNAAKAKYVELRPDIRYRRYVYSVSQFIEGYSQFGVLRQVVNSQSAESKAFVNSLKNIVATREPVAERTEKLRKEIDAFTALKGDKTSRAKTLLIQHNLFQADSNADSNVACNAKNEIEMQTFNPLHKRK